MTRPGDFEVRLQVQTAFDRVLVVEAGAGTGKTSVLTARILYWMLGPGWDLAVDRQPGVGDGREHDIATDVVSRVMALTFTEAAAAEMRLRILEGLRLVASKQDPGPSLLVAADFLGTDRNEYADRAQALIAASHRLVATTIHSFCNRLLLAHPLEAGLHPLPRVDADEEEIEEQVARLVAEEFVPLYESQDPVVRETVLGLAARGIGPSLVAKFLTQMARHAVSPDLLARRVDEPRFFDMDWIRRIIGPLAESLGNIAEQAKDSVSKKATATIRALEGIEKLAVHLAGSASALDALEVLDGLWNDERLKEWFQKKKLSKTDQNLFEAFPELPSRLSELVRVRNHLVLGPFKETIFPLARRLDDSLSRLGLLTYDALLRRAADLLGSHPEVARSLRRDMDLLVIDEFQDTDQVQCDIVARLALEGENRPSLMLVGDPKQSIYGFRSADLEAYDDFVARVIDNGGERLVLQANFRSHEAVLREVDRLVAREMKQKPGIQPGFQRLDAAARAAPVPGRRRRPVEYWVFPVEASGKGRGRKKVIEGPLPDMEQRHPAEQAMVEAEAIAADVAALHAEGVPWSDMALLLRSRTHSDVFLRALDRHFVPYVTSSSKGYYQREEVVLAVSLVQAILDWDDHLSLVAVLRSLLSGLPDAAIARLWGSGRLAARLAELAELREALEEQSLGCRGKDGLEVGRRAQVTEERQRDRWEDLVSFVNATARNVAGLPGMDRIEGWEKSFLHFLDALTRLRVSFRRRATDRFLDELRDLCAIEVMNAAFMDGPRRLANLQALFDDIQEAMEDASDPRAVTRTLRGWLEDVAQGEVDRPDTVADALSVLTIHGAKGLGFGHLYLANLGAQHSKKGNNAPVAFLTQGDSWEFRVGNCETDGWADALKTRAEKEDAEILRLFYVAATRAKSRVVFVGAWPLPPDVAQDKKSRDVRRLTSYVDLLGCRPLSEVDGVENNQTLRSWVVSLLLEEAGRIEKGKWDPDKPVLVDKTLEEDDQVRCVVFSPAFEALSRLDGWPGADASRSSSPGGEGSRDDLEARVAELAARTRSLGRKRQAAMQHMARPLSAGPSQFTGGVDRRSEAFVEEEEDPIEMGGETLQPGLLGLDAQDGPEIFERRIAGLLVHRALETWDVTRDPSEELARVSRDLDRRARFFSGEGMRGDLAADLARRLLGLFAGPGGLVERLRRIAPTVLGREVPILLAVDATLDERLGDLAGVAYFERPVSHWTGRVDLLYEDFNAGCLVVADYKTEPVSGASREELLAAARSFEPQLGLYAAAVRRALHRPLRAEVWFIEASRVVDLFHWEGDGAL